MTGRGAWLAEVSFPLNRTLQSKTRDVPVVQPEFGTEPVEMTGYRIGMHNHPAVQLLEDYIAYSADRAVKDALTKAMAANLDDIAKSLANSRARCSIVIRLGSIEKSESVDLDNVAKLIGDGLQKSSLMITDQQIDSLRIDAAFSRRAARDRVIPTYVSIIKTKGGHLSFLESIGEHVGRAFVYPSITDSTYFGRYQSTLYPNATAIMLRD